MTATVSVTRRRMPNCCLGSVLACSTVNTSAASREYLALVLAGVLQPEQRHPQFPQPGHRVEVHLVARQGLENKESLHQSFVGRTAGRFLWNLLFRLFV